MVTVELEEGGDLKHDVFEKEEVSCRGLNGGVQLVNRLSTLEVTQGQIFSQSSTYATPILVAFVWKLTKESFNVALGCPQRGTVELKEGGDVEDHVLKEEEVSCRAVNETVGQIDGFLSQLPYKCHQNRVASVGD